jgi:hypothetical protein
MNRFAQRAKIVTGGLASDDARFVTGAILPVDGGATAGRW